MPPTVRIHYNENPELDKAFASIQAELDARYHPHGLASGTHYVSPEDEAKLAELSSYAEHYTDDD